MSKLSEYEYKIDYLQRKIKEYEKILNINSDLMFDKFCDNYNCTIVENYFTILEKPSGEIYTKITKFKPESYYKYNSSDFDYLGENKTSFYTNGMYNQYNHKVIDQYIQFSFYL